MKCTAIAALGLVASSSAFMVSPVTMKVDSGVSRKEFAAKAAAGIAAASLPAAAFASGEGPKQNLFGIVGWGGSSGSVGGGGMSSPYAESNTYSPYSPYGNTDSGNAVYKGVGDAEMKFSIGILKDSQSKFEQIPKWIEGEKWEEVRAVLNQKAYNLRKAMNTLAKNNPQAAKDAKAYYKTLEDVTVSSRRKQGPAASAAYSASVEALNAFLADL